jgi:hypothetical protein
MNGSDAERSAQPGVDDGRDLLLRLYRQIGISAVVAAVEASRRPAPEDIKRDVKRETPAVLRDHDLAA